ncbi:MAG: beta-aspartyl-peptidase [Pyramidobacter sp.]|nr:beta-aspartyl-peptidase [Pyramidobacter sp.]
MNHPVILKNVDLYAPEHVGVSDVLVLGGKVAEVGKELDVSVPELEVIDCEGLVGAPGIIDHHNHFGGAGGEGGFNFRTPPAQLSSFVKAGITSAVGLLGTDGFGRSLVELLQKSRALEIEGLSTWIYTGSYQIPGPTITGSVGRDITLIDKVIGCKMALSDHRSLHPSVETIRQLISEVRVAGMLSGKRGVVCVHMGSEESGLEPLRQAVKGLGVPLSQFMPTHVARCDALLGDAVRWVSEGGVADITAGGKTPDAVARFVAAGVPLENICFSSDGNGSMPRFDAAGNLVGMGIGNPTTILSSIAECAARKTAPLSALFAMSSANPAKWLGLAGKGRVEKGFDADIMLLDEKMELRSLLGKGRMMMRDGSVLVKGTFE